MCIYIKNMWRNSERTADQNQTPKKGTADNNEK